jgi:ankyrin repeat protein
MGKLTPSVSLTQHPLEKWLVDAMLQGSARARNELRRQFPIRYDLTKAAIETSRKEAGNTLKLMSSWPPLKGSSDCFAALDPAAKAILAQPGISKLQFTSFIEALSVCEEIITAEGLGCLDNSKAAEPNALHYAALGGSPAMVNYLLKSGANPRAQTECGAAALHMAFLSHAPEVIIPILLSHGADPNVICTSSKGWPFGYGSYYAGHGTPLHFAVRCEDVQAARLLLEAGANPNLKDVTEISALEATLSIHSIELLEILLPYAVKDDENLPSMDELYPPLAGSLVSPMQKHIFWRSNPPDLNFVLSSVNCIKQHGLSFDYRGLLSAALDADNAELADICFQKLSSGEDGGLTKPYRCRRRYAASEGDTTVIDFHLSPDLKHVLFAVATACSPKLVDVVLRYVPRPLPNHGPLGIPILNAVGTRQFTSRVDAIRIVDALIEAGADMSALDEMGQGALRAAVFNNNHHVVNALLRHRPPLEDIESALGICIADGSSRVAEMMINRILSERPEVLVTPLRRPRAFLAFDDVSTRPRDTNFLRVVCDTWEFGRDDDINERILRAIISKTRTQPGGESALKQRLDEFAHPPFRNTPLHHAAQKGNVRAATVLVGAGAQLNICHQKEWNDFKKPDVPGSSALDIDLSFLSVGTNLSFLNSGPSPLDFAFNRKWDDDIYLYMGEHRELIKQLKQAGGTHKEEADYGKRTRQVIDYLRSKGAKTKGEIFGSPEATINSHEAARIASKERLKKRMAYRPPSVTSQRIMSFFGAAYCLPSTQNIMSVHPKLIVRPDRTRPRFSKLLIETTTEFRRILKTHPWVQEETQFRTSLEETLAQYEAWAERNNVRGGELDAIQEVPPGPQSVAISAALMYCFGEIARTLDLIQEFLLSSSSRTRRE